MALDAGRSVERQWTTRVALSGIHAYRATLSPLLGGAGVRCRFEPTCSRYGEAVVRRHGALRGGWMTLRRIARCGPWTPAGTHDPPPL